ncbi:hypothetical protein GWI33_002425 [Rhynchophorus ferrugineus]|uniref:Uncharacterized protein n=1 Tax=Rhynchophorus ferrugineus TaxID=354439 RepID=A0A834ITY6_RHYFE|nr:hypothetical protein GWI33_002425 [Rhynchophorus ferrugineus]
MLTSKYLDLERAAFNRVVTGSATNRKSESILIAIYRRYKLCKQAAINSKLTANATAPDQHLNAPHFPPNELHSAALRVWYKLTPFANCIDDTDRRFESSRGVFSGPRGNRVTATLAPSTIHHIFHHTPSATV